MRLLYTHFNTGSWVTLRAAFLFLMLPKWVRNTYTVFEFSRPWTKYSRRIIQYVQLVYIIFNTHALCMYKPYIRIL